MGLFWNYFMMCLRLFLYCTLFMSSMVFAAVKPDEVIQAWQDCQSQSSLSKECMVIGDQVTQISELADSMEMNPQHFGIDVMQLQDKISTMPNSKEKLTLNKELELRLAIIGWLRSPR